MIHALVALQMLAQSASQRLSREETGATAVEYALMVALIAVAIIVAVTALGNEISTLFCNVVGELGGTPC